MNETQQSIAQWAADTFGIASAERCALRAAEEMLEFMGFDASLLNMLALKLTDNVRLLEESADVVITLSTFAERCGVSLSAAVDKKMAINRARQWRVDGDGCGYHL